MHASRPIVSVVIPTRDRLGFLKGAVSSVLRQTLQPCEVIVVDDASSDGTPEWLVEQDPERVVVVRLEEHVERAIARNRGLDRARADYVLFLDDDDRLRVSAMQRLHTALSWRPELVGAVGARVLFNEEGHRKKVPHPRRRMERMVWRELLAGWMSPPGTVLWRTDVVHRVGDWNEAITLSGDRELFLRMAREGPVVFVPDVVLDKRAHAGQLRASDIRERKTRWMREFIESLPAIDRELASSAMRANRSWNDARIAYGNLQPRRALSLYLQAARDAPLVLASPLLRPQVGVGLAKSFVAVLAGPRILIRVRSLKRGFLRLLKREVTEMKREVTP